MKKLIYFVSNHCNMFHFYCWNCRYTFIYSSMETLHLSLFRVEKHFFFILPLRKTDLLLVYKEAWKQYPNIQFLSPNKNDNPIVSSLLFIFIFQSSTKRTFCLSFGMRSWCSDFKRIVFPIKIELYRIEITEFQFI